MNAHGQCSTDQVHSWICRYNNLQTAAPASRMDSLVILNLAHNEIRALFDSKGHEWTQLAVLNVSFNSLQTLPSSLGTAKRLQQLYVANNQLETLPDALGSLSLVDLFLSENAFRCAVVLVLQSFWSLVKLNICSVVLAFLTILVKKVSMI